ncbi:hypothetical protein V8E36_008476 [Tilletia maclaganii]
MSSLNRFLPVNMLAILLLLHFCTYAALALAMVDSASTGTNSSSSSADRAAAVTMTSRYSIHDLPHKTDAAHGQHGINDCIKTYGKTRADAECQTVVLNSVSEFCLWAPAVPAAHRSQRHRHQLKQRPAHHTPRSHHHKEHPHHSHHAAHRHGHRHDAPSQQEGGGATIGDSEASVIAYCTRSGFGTRLIPQGTIRGAQFRITPSFVQVSGVCDCERIGVARGDEGGELDPLGADGAGNPIGGLVFTNAWSKDPQDYTEIKAWSSFISDREFSFRACRGPHAADYCPHIYDLMGSQWNHPGRYKAGIFEDCQATEGQYPGVYNGVRWQQHEPWPPLSAGGSSHEGDHHHGWERTPPPHKAGATSGCKRVRADALGGESTDAPALAHD